MLAHKIDASHSPVAKRLRPKQDSEPFLDPEPASIPDPTDEEMPPADSSADPPTSPPGQPTFLRPQGACPRGLQPLIEGLLQDLPTYTELVAGRSLDLRSDQVSPFGTVIAASEPNFEPIDLAETPYGERSAGAQTEVQQVFFTTLERQYWQGKPFSLQNYHWLLLAEAENGWYLSQMYSSVGGHPAPAINNPTPPQESSSGIVGQAVTLWLRDCRAGAVFPPAAEMD